MNDVVSRCRHLLVSFLSCRDIPTSHRNDLHLLNNRGVLRTTIVFHNSTKNILDQ